MRTKTKYAKALPVDCELMDTSRPSAQLLNSNGNARKPNGMAYCLEPFSVATSIKECAQTFVEKKAGQAPAKQTGQSAFPSELVQQRTPDCRPELVQQRTPDCRL